MRQPTSQNASRVAKRTLLGLLILVFVGVGNSAVAQREAGARMLSDSTGNRSSQSGSRQAVPRSSARSGGSRSSSGSSSGGSRSSGSYSGSSAHRRTGTSGRYSSRGGYRPHYGGGYYGHSSYYGFGYGYGYGYGFYGYPQYGYWPAYSAYSYYPRYGGYVVADAGQYGRPAPIGAIDLNVKPKNTQVFVDGRYVGLTRSFDGFPDYLWLQRGSYELIFYLPGYENVVRRIEVIPGEVIVFQERLQAGVAELPEARTYVREPEPQQRPGRRAAPESDITDLRSEPASLDLRVLPAEASVYLDGRFLGSGRELSNLRAPLIIDSGDHVLQVVHPDFTTERREFTAKPGQDIDLEVQLGTGDSV